MCNDVLLIGRTGNQSNSPHFKFILVKRRVFTLYRNVLLMIDIYICVLLKVFCATCCSLKCKLAYMDRKEARVCVTCHSTLTSGEQLKLIVFNLNPVSH